MTHAALRFILDEPTMKTVAALESAGFNHVGTTTHAGHLLELTYFNKDAIRVVISFRYTSDEFKPVRREV